MSTNTQAAQENTLEAQATEQFMFKKEIKEIKSEFFSEMPLNKWIKHLFALGAMDLENAMSQEFGIEDVRSAQEAATSSYMATCALVEFVVDIHESF